MQTIDTARQPPRIETEIWEPAPGRPGFVRWQAQRSMAEVRADLIETLKHIDASDPDEEFYSANSVREWISCSAPASITEFPRGDPLVTVAKGSNEGYHILIISNPRKGDTVTVFTIKYLIDRDTVWRIAQALDQAFEVY